MQAADKAAERRLPADVFEAWIGALRRRNIHRREHYASHHLQEKGKQRGGAKDVRPLALFWHAMIQDRLQVLADAEPVVDRAPDLEEELDHASTSSLWTQRPATTGSLRHSTCTALLRMRTGNCCSACGGGPAATSPFL